MSDEHRRKISENHADVSGAKNPNYGKYYSPEARAKISATQKRLCANRDISGDKHPMYGRHHTDAAKAKIAIKAKQTWEDEEYKIKMSRIRTGKGHSVTQETKEKLSQSRMGPDNPAWLGGISYEPYCPKFNRDLKTRIRAFFDNHCILCGKSGQETVYNLACHHVEYDKAACCDGKPVQFAALCGKCHSKTNHDRSQWEAILHRIIEEIYGGRSYFTKNECSSLIKSKYSHLRYKSKKQNGK